jgi:hypothetical protein
MLVEPALAVIEGDSSQLADRTAQDLALFYAADNMHPSNFADLAAGRARRLRGAPLRAGDKVNWTAPVKPIREYSFVYPCVLEMGLIEMAGGPMPERMRQFLDWTYRNWCFSPAATILAGLCFSGSAPKGVMKKLRDVDRSRALKGLRNCAWDLAYVTRWAESVKRQSQETRLHVFCSFDKALCRVARLMFVESNRSDSEDAVADKLRELLGVDTYDYYRRLIKCSGEDDRPANRAGCLRARQIVTELERQVVEAI